MLKHYFRRRNPVLYGEDPKQNPVSGTAGGNQPSPETADEIVYAEEKKPEYALLTTAFSSAEQSIIESLLHAENIPYVLRRQDNESWKPAFLGAALLRTEIYVPQPMLDAASDLIADLTCEAAEDKAENGEIPDEVADEGGWIYYNRNHGLAEDNRLPAADADREEAPAEDDTEAGSFDENTPLLYDEETGYVRLITAMDNEEQLRIEAVLCGAEIPYAVREHDSEGRISVVMGASLFGNDIFVPEQNLDAAADLIVDLTCETAGDKAENGRIPAEVADAGGWYFYNQKHGLAEDNRELIGDRAETEQPPDNADNIH